MATIYALALDRQHGGTLVAFVAAHYMADAIKVCERDDPLWHSRDVRLLWDHSPDSNKHRCRPRVSRGLYRQVRMYKGGAA